jgi:NAD(P)-dependent dehydrogenase (short-subunit alcohol dehydrogenase family)
MGIPSDPLITSLTGKVALVTGGVVRVGRAIALALAGRGAAVAVTYLGESEPFAETVEDLRACGVEAAALQMDLQMPGAPVRAVQATVERFGRLDILVNSASVWLRSPFLEIAAEDWRAALEINLTGPFLMSQAAARQMLIQRDGLIINITDLSAFQPWPEYAHHGASKAGLVALTRTMAVELAPYVRVNAVAPGTVLLPENAPPAKLQWAEQKSLLRRVGHPEDVARTVLYLVDSDFATGAVYFIDGGRALVG